MVLANSCESESCIGYGLVDETFQALAGETYYFMVGGYNGAEGGFTITVNCEDG